MCRCEVYVEIRGVWSRIGYLFQETDRLLEELLD